MDEKDSLSPKGRSQSLSEAKEDRVRGERKWMEQLALFELYDIIMIIDNVKEHE